MSERLTKAQRALLAAMDGGATLTTDILAGYPSLSGPDHCSWPRQQTVAACEKRGWIIRVARFVETTCGVRFRFGLTDAGRRALQGDQQ